MNKLLQNETVELDTALDFSIAGGQLNNLEELMLVLKYSFA